MNEVVFKTLKNKDYIVKNFVFKIAKELNLSLNELILLIYFINQEVPVLNIDNIKKNVYLNEEEAMEAFDRLIGIGLITMDVVKNDDGTRTEVISLDNIYQSVTTEITRKGKAQTKKNIFEEFEREFGRPLSPMEFEIINDWLNKNVDESLIEAALKETIFNGVKSLRYVSKVLLAWQDKGYKTAADVKKGYRNESESSDYKELFDYNWLDEE